MPPKSIVIRKYENRRLYDVTNSRYVNLEEVAQLLRDGHDVQVVDAASGQDITRLVLTQIIVEDARTPDSTFPLDLLRQMIVSSGRATQETALRHMKTMLGLYQDTYRAMAPAVDPFDFFRQSVAGSAPPGPPPAPPADPPRQRGDADSGDVDELKRRVAGLEKLVASLSPDESVPSTRRSSRKKKPSRS